MIKPSHFFTVCAFLTFLTAITPVKVSAQNTNPLGFKVTCDKPDAKAGDTVRLWFEAHIPPGWHVFGTRSDCPEDDGPIRASITLDSGSYVAVGEAMDVGADMVKDDEIWKCSTSEFHRVCGFTQKVLLTAPISAIVVHIYAQKCSDKDGVCLLMKETVTYVPPDSPDLDIKK